MLNVINVGKVTNSNAAIFGSYAGSTEGADKPRVVIGVNGTWNV